MNVLFIYDSCINPVKGGIERVTCVISSFFEQKGHRVYFLSLRKDDSIDDPRQLYVPDSTRLYAPRNVRYFLDFLKERRIDIVINQGGISPKVSEFAYCCKRQKVILISVIHNSLFAKIHHFSAVHAYQFRKNGFGWLIPLTNYPPVKHFLKWLYIKKYRRHFRKLCKTSDAVILQSDKFKQELQDMTGNRIDNASGIPNPVSFSVAGGAALSANKKKEILYVGRIDFSQKRLDLLLEIWMKLYKRFPEWRLRVVGGGALLDEVAGLSEKLQLQNITFEGFQDPQDYYRDAALFCMTSTYESFGIVLVEAMQFGAVPFAFDSYLSVTDIIDNNINGVLIPAFDTEKYAACLERFMLDEDLSRRVGAMAVEKAKEFSIERIGEKWETLFAGLQKT
jgi:glycosyltransferase involved in cell wall biosynthesis